MAAHKGGHFVFSTGAQSLSIPILFKNPRPTNELNSSQTIAPLTNTEPPFIRAFFDSTTYSSETKCSPHGPAAACVVVRQPWEGHIPLCPTLLRPAPRLRANIDIPSHKRKVNSSKSPHHIIADRARRRSIKKWLGHAKFETTAIYLDATGDEERELAERMWRPLDSFSYFARARKKR